MATITHTTGADGTFSAAGALAWEEEHTLVLGADENFVTDAELTAIGGARKFKAPLSPASAELVGSTDEPTLIGVASATAQQAHWSELRYSDTAASEAVEQEAQWLLGSVITKDYAGGALTVRLRWFATAITGNVIWRVKLLGRTTGEVLDAALVTTDHSVTTAVAGTTLQLVTSEITFTPAAAELTAGDTWLVAIRRSAFLVGDTMTGDAKLVDAGVFEV